MGNEMAVEIYLILINLISFVLFGMDKLKARNHQWRISEKTLFLFAASGGSAGAIAGMYVFRHKTKHWYFRYGLPLILVVQVVCMWWVLRNGAIL